MSTTNTSFTAWYTGNFSTFQYIGIGFILILTTVLSRSWLSWEQFPPTCCCFWHSNSFEAEYFFKFSNVSKWTCSFSTTRSFVSFYWYFIRECVFSSNGTTTFCSFKVCYSSKSPKISFLLILFFNPHICFPKQIKQSHWYEIMNVVDFTTATLTLLLLLSATLVLATTCIVTSGYVDVHKQGTLSQNNTDVCGLTKPTAKP